VEDWEQFFIEKSRRRFEKDRVRRRRPLLALLIVVTVACAILVGASFALTTSP
jgi:hypothetical protein